MNNKLKGLFIFMAIACIASPVFAFRKSPASGESTLKRTQTIEGIGKFTLRKQEARDSICSELILEKSKTLTVVVDTFNGLEPYELLKWDFDKDGLSEIIVSLKYPNSDDVTPYIYTFSEGVDKIFPTSEDMDLTGCREIFITNYGSKSALCLKYLVSYHDYGPPQLFKLEMYVVDNGKPSLAQVGYNEGKHYNLLMNLAGEYMHNGNMATASELYDQAVSSSTGDISKEAFAEALFFKAECLKFSGKYKEAMKLYEKVVLEFTDSAFTEASQQELEFLFANNQNKLIGQYFNVLSLILQEKETDALSLINSLIKNNPNSKIMDRMLFTKAELLTSFNKLDEAMTMYKTLLAKYSDSPLIEKVNELLEDLEARPEETDGL